MDWRERSGTFRGWGFLPVVYGLQGGNVEIDVQTEGSAQGRGKWVSAAAWGIAAVLSLTFFVVTRERVDPATAVPVKLTRGDAVAQARAYLAERGIDVSSYKPAAGFYSNRSTRDFLEKNLPAGEASRLMRDEVATWYWYVRFVVPEQEEELQVSLWPDGRICYFGHHIPEAREGATLTEPEAQTRAEAFLGTLAHIDQSEYEIVDHTQQTLPERSQFSFAWQKRDFDLHGAKYRVYVTVSGDAVTTFSEGLHIAEDTRRAEAQHASRRQLLSTTAAWLAKAINFASIIALIWAIRARQARFRFALGLGVLLAVSGFILWANALPTFWMSYPTAESVQTYATGLAFGTLSGIVSVVLSSVFLFVPGDAITRRVLPGHAEFSRVFSLAFWRSGPALIAVGVGLCLACIHAGFFNAFYLIAQRFGAWCPLDAPYTDALEVAVPSLYPLQTGISAALREESLYRYFGIALLLLLTKRSWFAVLVPAVVWGFCHSAYPQEPIYIRGIEVSIIGIIYGFVFLRYGVLATIVAHYTYNALVGAVFLFESGNRYFQLSGLVVVCLMAVPALPGIWRYLRGRALLSTSDLNSRPYGRTQEAGVQDDSQETNAPYERIELLPARTLITVAAIALVSLCVVLACPKHERYGDYVRVTSTPGSALKAASDFLRTKGIDPQTYKTAVTFNDSLDGDMANYTWQKVGLTQLNAITRERFPQLVVWRVRYFRPLEKDEYNVYVLPDGKAGDYFHTRPEDAQGAELGKEEAMLLAAEYARVMGGIELSNYHLADWSHQKRPSRTDHTFVWEDNTFKVGEAPYRLSVSVIGDEACGLSHYLDIPEEWYRERSKFSLRETVFGGIVSLLLLLGSILFLVAIIRVVRARALHFWPALIVALCIPLLSLAGPLDCLRHFGSDYSTSDTWNLYLGKWVLFTILSPAVKDFALAFLVVLIGDGVFRLAFPTHRPLIHWFGFAKWDKAFHPSRLMGNTRTRLIWGEAILIGCAVSAMSFSLDQVSEYGFQVFSATFSSGGLDENAPTSVFTLADADYSPATETVADSLAFGIAGSMTFALFVGLYALYIKKFHRFILIALGILVLRLALVPPHSPAEWTSLAQTVSMFLVFVGFLYVLFKWICRSNVMTYFIYIFCDHLYREAHKWIGAYTWEGKLNAVLLMVTLTLLITLGIWLSLPRWRGEPLTVQVPEEEEIAGCEGGQIALAGPDGFGEERESQI